MSARSASPVVKEQTNVHAEKVVTGILTPLSYEAILQDAQNAEDLAEKRAQWLSTYKSVGRAGSRGGKIRTNSAI